MNDCIKPSARQVEYQDWELGLFMHFGVLTFCEGLSHNDLEKLTPARFNPTKLDCDQWAETAVAAGCRYSVLTAKHHDGFANWPSKYTDFSVASSPWKGGKGDVIREYVEAFKKRGLAVGIYYSPYDASSKSFEQDAKVYDDYFINQISELLVPYGEIDIVWFDGAGSEGHKYDWLRIVGEIRRMQPNILIFQMGGDPDIRWAGNEAGIAPYPNWNVVGPGHPPVPADDQLALKAPKWVVAECDSMLSEHWFYSSRDVQEMKTLDTLMGMYCQSVGRGANMLVNIGPGPDGRLPEECAGRLVEFGREVKRRFASPFAKLADFEQTDGNTWKYAPDKRFFVDHAVIQEDVAKGEHIRRFEILVNTDPECYAGPVKVFSGESVGHKVICKFPVITASQVFVRVLEADGPVNVRSIELFNTADTKK